ncbi:MAG TPA: ABC transporter permease, partial [Candidatus Acidoferrales bacterium]|nr:ABC transporter permease [Candidatus Acidoferrales bacterium]
MSYGLRQIRNNLSLTILCVAVLAIGIGAATAVFTVLYDALLEPLPYRDASRIVFVHNTFPSSPLGETGVSPPDYVDLAQEHKIFAQTAAYYFKDFTMSSSGNSEYAEHIDAVHASATLFSLLGIHPQLGRAILPADDHFGGAKVVLLSDAFWRSTFNADPRAIGTAILLDGEPYRIIGVMPADFNFPYPATQMWVPMALNPARFAPSERPGKWLRMIARLAPGVDIIHANAMLATFGHALAVEYPTYYPEKTGWRFSIRPLLAERSQTVRKWLLLAFGAVVCVLLIACANVSGLLLVRAGMRSREWAVRAALGASHARIARQILTEAGLLAFAGCAAGAGLAAFLVQIINLYGPVHRTEIEPWTMSFALALCAISTLAAGLLPAFLSSRAPIEQSLRTGAGRTTTGQSRWRGALVAAQISIAVALLFTATVLSRSFVKLLDISPGFSPEHVWSGAVALPHKGYEAPPSDVAFFRELVHRIAALPGVQSASADVSLPFSSGGYMEDVYFPGRPESNVRPAARMDNVLPNYFETLKIPLLKGRTFTASDSASAPVVAIIDEDFARKYFPDTDPIGKLVAYDCCRKELATIIGIVGNVAEGIVGASAEPEIYWPALQEPNSAMFLVIRESGRTDVTSAVREILHQQDPAVALFDVQTMPARIADSLKVRRFVAWLLNGFALAGVILAALGLYGALAYAVQLRRREMAIRMAFGAAPADVAGLVWRHSLAVTLAGIVPGIVLCGLAAQLTRSLVFQVAPLDLATLAYTAAGLAIIVTVATWMPVSQA